MRNVFVIAAVAALFGCSNDAGPGTDTDANGDGLGSNEDGGTSNDGGTDGNTSYAPCDTCCDPIAQNCSATQACYENAQFNGTYCATAGTRPAGTSCGTDSDCVKGTTCLGAGFNQCRKFCVTDADCPASPMHHCEPYIVTAGHNPYGICF